MPHFNNIYFSSLVKKHSMWFRVAGTTDVDLGTYVVIRGLIATKVALAVIMFLAGADNIVLLTIFIASNRIFTEVPSSPPHFELNICLGYM